MADLRYYEAEKILKNRTSGTEEFVGSVYALTSDPRLISDKVPLGEKYGMAFKSLIQILHSGPPEISLNKLFGKEEEKKEKETKEGEKAQVPATAVATVDKNVQSRGDQKQPTGKMPETKTPDYYDLLGVDRNASYQEVRSAYRRLMKQYHPDILRSKELSPEEMAAATAKAQELNAAYMILGDEVNRRDYDALQNKEGSPRPRPTSKAQAQEEATKMGKGFIVVETKPTTSAPVTKTKEVQGFKNTVDDAGDFELDETTLKELKGGGFIPKDAKSTDITSAFHLYAKGVRGVDLASAARDSAFLKDGERESLYNTAYVMELLEASNLSEIPNGPSIQDESHNPKVVISDSGLNPILEMGKDKAMGKIKGLATDAIKKGSARLTKEGSKVIAKVGLKFAAKLGIKGLIQGAAQALNVIPGLGVLVGIGIEVASWVFGKLKNLFSGILRALTGEKDLRKQVALIAGSLAVVLFGMGYVGPALALGLISVGALAALAGGAAIAGGFGGFVGAFTFALTGVLLPSLIVPFVVAFVVVPIIIVFILFIINTSAYVVPPGGGIGQGIGLGPGSGVTIPAVSCFVPVGNWPATDAVNLDAAMNRLVNDYPAYVNRVCSGGGAINLCYDPPQVLLWGYHRHDWPGGCDIFFSSGGFTNSSDATYILAHELGHHLEDVQAQTFQLYLDYPQILLEPSLCSYPATVIYRSERFAEAIALYIQQPTFWGTRCGATNFRTRYPIHWQYVNDIIMQ